MKPYTKEDVRTLGPGAEVYLQARDPYVVPNFPVQVVLVNEDLVRIRINNTYNGAPILHLLLYGVNVEDSRGWILWPDRPTREDRKAVQWENISYAEFKRRQLERAEAIEARLHAAQKG